METMINNLINVNIADARKQAKRFGYLVIADALMNDYGWSHLKAWRAVTFLKTGEGWQAYCDAK